MREPKEIELPFYPQFIPLIRSGAKTCTTRRSRKGRKGDVFHVDGTEYRIVRVEPMSLFKAYSYWKVGGFESTMDMADSFRTIYPDLTIADLVYVHHFKEVVA